MNQLVSHLKYCVRPLIKNFTVNINMESIHFVEEDPSKIIVNRY